ncbi:unnamed protein product, partial [Linum tenue]
PIYPQLCEREQRGRGFLELSYVLLKGAGIILLPHIFRCIRDVESAHERPPAKADRKTLPAGISTGGAT